jgi:peptidoglycan/LPS O-acetylase OafA/YrhL
MKMIVLPEDLERLGDALAVAAERRVRARRRRRLARAGVVGALAFAALTPGTLGGAQQQLDVLQFAAAPGPVYVATACGQPRGARFTPPRPCELLHPAPQALR